MIVNGGERNCLPPTMRSGDAAAAAAADDDDDDDDKC